MQVSVSTSLCGRVVLLMMIASKLDGVSPYNCVYCFFSDSKQKTNNFFYDRQIKTRITSTF